MMLVEVFVPTGMLGRDERAQLARRLTTRALHPGPKAASDVEAERADPGVMDFLETITTVLVHEVDVWVAGGEVFDPAGPHRYLVRVHVPGPWRKELSEHLVTRISNALAALGPDPEETYREPVCQVHVLGIPDGGFGTFGKVINESTLLRMIKDARRGADDAPQGMAIDPVCGATVPVTGATAVTAEADGTTHAFCCAGCRHQFLTQHRNAASGA